MKSKSFTLIELLVIIVIIGILAGVIMISTSSSITKANITKSKVFEGSVENNLAANMVSRWKLDEVTGTAIPYKTPDQWGNNIGTLGDGTCMQGAGACPTLVLGSSNQCVSDNCMSFDGGDYINIAHNSSIKPTDKIVVSAWANFNSWSSAPESRLLSCTEAGGYNISSLGAASSVNMYINGSYRSVQFYNTAPSSGWHFFTTTFDGRYLKTYFDGLYKNQYDALANYSIYYNISNSLIIGAEAGGGSTPPASPDNFPIQGKIDDVRIYDGVLSAFQIKQNYIAGLDSLLSNGNIYKEEYNERIKVLAYEK